MSKTCKCCGEPMDEQDAGNPNMCSPCASLLDNASSVPGVDGPPQRKTGLPPLIKPVASVSGVESRN